MKDSKLIHNLEALTPKEIRRFGDFVHSPFFNKHKETTALFDVLIEEQGRWSSLTKQEVYHMIYSTPYLESRMNNLMSYLTELLKQFLAQVEYSENHNTNHFLLKASIKRSMWKLFDSTAEKERKALLKEKTKDEKFYQRRLQYERLKDTYISVRGKKHDPSNLEKGEEIWEISIILEKLKQSCEMLNRMVMYNYKYDLGILDHLLDHLKERWTYFEKVLVINIYYQILNIFLDPGNHSRFYDFVDFIEKHRSKCSQEDLKLMYSYAINRGIESLNLDEKRFSNATFKLYQLMIEDGLHLENKEIHHMFYKNITVLACKVGEFEWAKNFMATHRSYLNSEIRKNTYNFNLAYLHYTQKQYDEALILLSKLNFENVFYQINAKILQIKIFYELKEYDLLLSFLESFRLFLIRNKRVSTGRIKVTQNFVLYTRKFTQILYSEKLVKKEAFQNALKQLKEELLLSKTQLINKSWLIENIEAIVE